MDGGNGGAAVRGQAAAGVQGSAEPETQTAQVTAGGVGGAAGIGGDKGAVTDVVGAVDGTAGADPAAKACADYEKALAERDERIAELEGEIAEAARTAEGAERLRAEMDELRRASEEQRVSFELQLAGARNVKAATALLADYDNDIERLKVAEPWLSADASAPKQTGKTGLPNAGAASDEGKTVRRWREIAGLPAEKDGER